MYPPAIMDTMTPEIDLYLKHYKEKYRNQWILALQCESQCGNGDVLLIQNVKVINTHMRIHYFAIPRGDNPRRVCYPYDSGFRISANYREPVDEPYVATIIEQFERKQLDFELCSPGMPLHMCRKWILSHGSPNQKYAILEIQLKECH